MATKLNFEHIVRNRPLQWIATACLLLITFYLFVFDAARGNLLDFRIYFEASLRIANGESPYEPPYHVLARDGRTFELRYLYPPFLALAITPLTSLPYETAKLLWCLLNYALLIGCAVVTSSLLAVSLFKNLSRLEQFLISMFFMCCFEPVYTGVMDGQAHIIVLLLVLLFFHSALNRAAISGTWLAFAGALKMSPALMGLGLLFSRSWKAMALCGATLVSLVVALIFSGLTSSYGTLYSDFFTSTTQLMQGETFRKFTFNLALDRALLSMLSDDSSLALRMAIKTLLSLGLLSIAAWLWGFRVKVGTRAWGEHRTARMYGFLVSSFILLSPIVWFHHLTWALAPLVALLMHTPITGQAKLRHLTIVLALYFFMSQVAQMQVIALREFPVAFGLTSFAPSVGLAIILWLLTRAELRDAN